jgi:DNA-directed RNA polymerase specialized sigma24 family protein
VAAGGRRTLPLDDSSMPQPPWTDDADVDEQLLGCERVDGLYEAIEHLSEAHRKLISLLLSEPPLSYAEIAETLQIPIGSIGPTRARCLRKLRGLMAPLADSF